jgi:ubiquitin-like-conjugating enzyme ATG3
MVDSIKNSIYKGYTSVMTPLIGTLKESKFLEKGVLTPEEFVIAGDNLTHKCNTWKWMGCSADKFDKRFPDQK